MSPAPSDPTWSAGFGRGHEAGAREAAELIAEWTALGPDEAEALAERVRWSLYGPAECWPSAVAS